MIHVTIKSGDDLLGEIEITKVTEEVSEFADYRIKYVVNRGSAMAMHQRVIYGFPRKYYNVFAIVLQALNALNEKDLKLERDFDPDEAPVSADMAGGLDRTMRALPQWFGRLHRN